MVQAESDRILAILRRTGWAGRLEPGLAEALVEAGRLVRLPQGAWSHGEGDPETGILVVIEGAVQLFTEAPGDRQVLVGHVERGGTIGQANRFGGGPRIVTAIAVVPSQLLIVSDAALTRLSAAWPDLWRMIAGLAYAQMRVTVQMMAQVIALPPRQRVAARLLALAAITGERAPLTLSIGQQALGELVGLTRKTVNGLLQDFAREGLVRLRYAKLELVDLKGLDAAANG
ncbi:MAG: Crp/Fnr family transcriptional regulator [Micropepsaceae bacterium]